VTTLEQQGFLQHDAATQKYSVGPRLFELGLVYVRNLEINVKGAQPAQNIAARTGLITRIGIFDSGSVLITFLAVPRSEDHLSHQIGPRTPACCSAIGKAMIAKFSPTELNAFSFRSMLSGTAGQRLDALCDRSAEPRRRRLFRCFCWSAHQNLRCRFILIGGQARVPCPQCHG
jgi:DNA-binding IclR family transcriptional regulator